jgi:hypothetical protein
MPGHPVVNLIAGALKAGQWAGVVPANYRCKKCGKGFVYALGTNLTD